MSRLAHSLILVIDDDASVRDLTDRFLTREGFTVITAATGLDGLRLARERHPAAVVLDVMMPGMDGWTVLAAMKGDPTLADIPVVMMTIVDDRTRGYSLGATDYMLKPVNREQLRGVLGRICATGRNALLVDDDEFSRRRLCSALVQDGWQVAEAVNGRLALEHLEHARPDAIILDLMMPEMNGFDFLDEMRRRAELRDIPVLVLTAKDLSDSERSRLNAGVQSIVQKRASEPDLMLGELRRALMASIERGHSRGVAPIAT